MAETDLESLMPFLSIALLLLGFVCVLLEVFVPSGGVLGVLAAVLLITAVTFGFVGGGQIFGVVVLAVAFLTVPVLVGWGLSVWPKTPLGRQMVLWPPEPSEGSPTDGWEKSTSARVGQIGVAVTELLPGGVVEIGGREFSAVASFAPVPKGTIVRVKEVRISYLVVEPFLQETAGEHPSADVSKACGKYHWPSSSDKV